MYKDVIYKLIQNNPRKYSDQLITIIPEKNNISHTNNTYLNASEYLSALSWVNDSIMKLRIVGKCNIPNDFNIKNARSNFKSYPEITYHGMILGDNINRIAFIENNFQREALTLFREAKSSNNEYLSFIFYWQIFEIGNHQPIGWINKTIKKNTSLFHSIKNDLDSINVSIEKLGNYFYDDCRTALSHLFTLKGNKRRISIESPDDNLRIRISNQIIYKIVKYFIENELALNKYLYLIKEKGDPFLVYKYYN